MSYFPIRYVVYAGALMGTTVAGALYSTVHFSWVCMVRNSTQQKTSAADALDWGSREQQFVYAGFSLGILVVPVGWLTRKLGSRAFFAAGIGVSAIATLLVPVAADNLGNLAVMLLRIFVGMGASGAFFCLPYEIASAWAPQAELGTALAIATSGRYVGQFATYLVAGVECKEIGWEWIFYLGAVCAIPFTIFWSVLYRNSPIDVGLIDPDELSRILEGKSGSSSHKTAEVPWIKLMTNMPVLSCLICRFCSVFFFNIICQYMPTYLRDVIHLPPDTNGYFSCLPLLTTIAGRLTSGCLSDIKCGSDTIRLKIINTIAFVGPGCCALAIANLPEVNPSVAENVALLSLAAFLAHFSTGGHMKAPLLITPEYSREIGAVMTAVTGIAALTVPFVVNSITIDRSRAEWNVVFYVFAGVAVSGASVFLLFGSGERQDFDLAISKDDKKVPVKK